MAVGTVTISTDRTVFTRLDQVATVTVTLAGWDGEIAGSGFSSTSGTPQDIILQVKAANNAGGTIVDNGGSWTMLYDQSELVMLDYYQANVNDGSFQMLTYGQFKRTNTPFVSSQVNKSFVFYIGLGPEAKGKQFYACQLRAVVTYPYRQFDGIGAYFDGTTTIASSTLSFAYSNVTLGTLYPPAICDLKASNQFNSDFSYASNMKQWLPAGGRTVRFFYGRECLVNVDYSQGYALYGGTTGLPISNGFNASGYQLVSRSTTVPPGNFNMAVGISGYAYKRYVYSTDFERNNTFAYWNWNYVFSGEGIGSITLTSAPPTPGAFTLAAIGYSNAVFSFTDSSTDSNRAASYQLEQSDDGGTTYYQVQESSPSDLTALLTGLNPGTTYYWRLRFVNAVGSSSYAAAISGTTASAPDIPSAPTGVTATGYNKHIVISWTASATVGVDGYKVYGSSSSGGPYTFLGTVAEGVPQFIDTPVAAAATKYYRVSAYIGATDPITGVSYGSESLQSSEVSANTLPEDGLSGTVCPFALTSGAKVTKLNVGGRLQIWSNLDRGVTFINNRWYRMGLKPLLTAATIADGGSATDGLTGTFQAYIVLKRTDGNVRSIPSPVSNTITISNRKITITPPTTSGEVTVRDIAYDANGNLIDAADRWEIYLYETSLDIPVLIADMPIGTTTYTTPDGLNTADLNTTVRRPMEVLRESAIPPACEFALYYGNRVWACGESTIKPTETEIAAGCTIAITNGATTATTSGYTPSDAIINKELYLNGGGTGWFVVDVQGTTIYLFNDNPAKYSAGLEFTTGAYADFRFVGSRSKIYRSAFFPGEPNGNASYNFEGFSPLDNLVGEFEIDDNQDIVGMVEARGGVFVGKRQKWFFCTGGTGMSIGFDGKGGEDAFPRVTKISSTSGLLAPRTLCTDRFDNVFYLGDQGPMMVTPSGVQKVGLIAGAGFMFQSYFRKESASEAIGCWYAGRDWFVVTGLDRTTSTGKRDGFILDMSVPSNPRVCPISHNFEVTALIPAINLDGQSQLIYGDAVGNIGILMDPNESKDGANYQLETPSDTAVPMVGYITTGVISNMGQFTVPSIATNWRPTPDTTASRWSFQMDAKPVISDGNTFTATSSGSWTTDVSRDFFRVSKYRTQAARFRMDVLPESKVRLSRFAVDVVEHGRPGQDQD